MDKNEKEKGLLIIGAIKNSWAQLQMENIEIIKRLDTEYYSNKFYSIYSHLIIRDEETYGMITRRTINK